MVESTVPVDVVEVPYGTPAVTALASAIRAAKRDAPLAAVTVIVPSNFAGLAARRAVGSGRVGLDGVANVNFLTAWRLAEMLAAGQMGSRRPLTNPVLFAAVRRALAEDPRHFAAVRNHQTTEEAVASVSGELANVSAAGLEAIEAAGGDAADVIAVHRTVRQHLSGFHDEADVARAGTHRDDLGVALTSLGHLIWYLPGTLSAPLATMLSACFQQAPATVILGRSGAAGADAEPERACRIAGVSLAATDVAAEAPLAQHVISVTDADEEVRTVLREVIQLASEGVRLDRIGIFHPTPDPYVRLLEQHFRAADIPANGPSRRRLSESVAGRVLLRALGLRGDRWRRDRVLALVSTGPLRFGGEPVRPAAWETLSRQAGVVGDLGDWRVKLARHAATIEARVERAQAVGGFTAGHERTLADTNTLLAFVEQLGEMVHAVDAATTWAGRCQAAGALLHELLGRAHTHQNWPEDEQAAFERIETVLERLALLDEIEPDASHAVFLRALRAELDVARDRSGRFGEGVTYGPLSSAPGLDFDAVFLLGCTEGLNPAPRREDPLLPDAARKLTRGDLPERLGRLGEQHRLFLAAVAAGPEGRRWLMFPRGDLRSSRNNRPSRWLLPSASALAGEPLLGTSFEHGTPPDVHEVRSHADAHAAASHFSSLNERDVAVVYRYITESGGDAATHDAIAPVARAIELQRARRSRQFTVWDGNLAGHMTSIDAGEPLSASRLETWASCGFRYFLSYVLGLRDRDDPDRTLELSALDRGSALHRVLEVFIDEMIAAGAPDPATRWTPEQREHAHELAVEEFDGYEQRGRTGRNIDWQVKRSDLFKVIDDFLDADDEFRSKARVVPTELEYKFGFDATDAVKLDLSDGRSLQFRGFIDRIDRRGDGHVLVSDYKTGSARRYKKLDDGDPTLEGTALQLGLYAEAASQLLGATTVDTHYWMVGRGPSERHGYAWTPARRERLVEVLDTIATGIDTGVFAAVPGEWQSFRSTYENCTWCAFDSICPRDRSEHANEKLDTDEVSVRLGLKPEGERGDDIEGPN